MNLLKKKRNFKLLIIAGFFVVFIFGLTPIVIQEVSSTEVKQKLLDSIGIKNYTKVKQVYFSVINLKYLPLKRKKTIIPSVNIFIAPADLQKITSNLTQESKRERVKASIIYNNAKYDVKLKIKGGGANHWRYPKKSWSVIAEDNLIDGKNRINFIVASDKGFINEIYGNFFARQVGLIVPDSRGIDLFINGERQGFYYELEHWGKEMLEKQSLTGDTNFYGNAMGFLEDEIFDPKMYTHDPRDQFKTNTDLVVLKKIFNNPDNDFFWKNIFSIIDKENFFAWQAHSVILGSTHQYGSNVKMYFNNTKGVFEFLPWDLSYLNYPQYVFGNKESIYNKLVTRILQNPAFMHERNKVLYAIINNEEINTKNRNFYKKLKNDSKLSIVKDSKKPVSTKSSLRWIDYFENYNINRIKVIEKELGGGELYAFLKILDKGGQITLRNNHISPAYIKNITFKYNNLDNKMDEISLIDNEGNEFKNVSCIPAEKKCIINLDKKIIFSDRKLDETNTFFEVDQKEYVFEIVGDISSFRKIKISAENAVTNKNLKGKAINIEYIDKRLFSNLGDKSLTVEEFVRKNPEFTINKNNELSIGPGSYFFNRTVIVPSGAKLNIVPNTLLQFSHNISLLSYSPVSAIGKSIDSIQVKLNSGVFGIVKAQDKSIFENCVFSRGGEDTINGIFLSGMLSAYHSQIEVNNCRFFSATGDDALNIKYAKTEIRNNIFRKNKFDALDVDFITEGSLIYKNIFEDNGNDSIDLSGSVVIIDSNKVYSSGDKCISIGEQSDVNLINNLLKSCLIGLAVKDKSKAVATQNIIVDNKEGVSLYRKKEIFDGAQIELYNNVLWENKVDLNKDEYSEVVACSHNILQSEECTGGIELEPMFDTDYSLLNRDEIKIYFKK
jgi:hypothetical protein